MPDENEQFTQSDEKYIIAIFNIIESSGNSSALTGEIAKYINAKSSSVTEMLLKMHKKELVIYTKYNGAQLTAQGIELANYAKQKNKVWGKFLVKHLLLEPSDAHELAKRLSVIPSKTLHKKLWNFQKEMSQLLIKPQTKSNSNNIVKLSDLKVNDLASVAGYASMDNAFFDVVKSYQLFVGVKIFLSYKDELSDLLMITTESGNNYTISLKLANKILTTKL